MGLHAIQGFLHLGHLSNNIQINIHLNLCKLQKLSHFSQTSLRFFPFFIHLSGLFYPSYNIRTLNFYSFFGRNLFPFEGIERMLSYLCNRHYYSMTQVLPESLRPNQPEVLYYKTFINQNTLKVLQKNQKVNYRTLALKHKRNPIKKQKSLKPSEKYADGCPICFQKHIYVEFYGHRHICSKCRNFVRDEHGNQVKIFKNEDNQIVCLGMYPKESRQEVTKYYATDYTKLQVSNTGVFATFGGPNQLVLITREKPIIEETEDHD